MSSPKYDSKALSPMQEVDLNEAKWEQVVKTRLPVILFKAIIAPLYFFILNIIERISCKIKPTRTVFNGDHNPLLHWSSTF